MLQFALLPALFLSASLVYFLNLLGNGKFLVGLIGILIIIFFLWLQGKTSAGPEKK